MGVQLSMNGIQLVFFSFIFQFTCFAQVPEVKKLPIYLNDYLVLKDPTYVHSKSKRFPTLKIFKNPELKGAPYIQVDKRGVLLNSKIMCGIGQVEGGPITFLLLKNDNKDRCKENIFPIVSTSESKIDSPHFWILANGKHTDIYYEASNRSEKFYIDKSTAIAFDFRNSISKITTDQYKKNFDFVNSYIKKFPDFQTFLKNTSKCIENKDLNCLHIKNEVWEEQMKSWAMYFCVNHKEKNSLKFQNYCGEVMNYLCANNRIIEPDLVCPSGLNPENYQDLKITNRKEKSAAEDILWKEI